MVKNEDLLLFVQRPYIPLFSTVFWQGKGYFPVEELNTFRLIDSRFTKGHPTTHEAYLGNVLLQVLWAKVCL